MVNMNLLHIVRYLAEEVGLEFCLKYLYLTYQIQRFSQTLLCYLHFYFQTTLN